MKHKTPNTDRPAGRVLDMIGSCGMILIAAGLLIPLFNMFNPALLDICKWIYAAGALAMFVSKISARQNRSESFRLRRLRRMEFWAATCFVVGAALWFYNAHKFAKFPEGTVGALAIIRDTILFAISGAVLQIVSVWMIYFREKKEARDKA